MPKYNVEKNFWRGGLPVAAGSSVYMSKAEAKYLGHVLTEVDPEAVAKAKTKKAKAAAAPAPLGASVVETSAANEKANADGDNSVN